MMIGKLTLEAEVFVLDFWILTLSLIHLTCCCWSCTASYPCSWSLNLTLTSYVPSLVTLTFCSSL